LNTRAVLLDLDDTLIDHTSASRAAASALHARYAFFQCVPLEQLVAENHRILDLLHHPVAIGRCTPDEARTERYRRLFAWAGADSSHDPAEAATMHRDVYLANRCCVPGAVELVRALADRARIAIVTNNTVREQTEKLAAFGLAPFVHTLVTSEEIGIAKPERAMFDAALRALDCAAADAVMVGDSWHHDVAGAHAAGIRAVWFNRTKAACQETHPARELHAYTPLATALATILSP
jgi:putative hydrolase of the HAD superfamily